MECVPTTRADASRQEAPAGNTEAISVAATKEGTIKLKGASMTDDKLNLPEAQPGSQEVLMSEVRYAIVFGEMNEIVNGRIHRLLTWITVFAAIMTVGGAAVVIGKAAASAGISQGLALATFILLVIAAAAEATKRACKFDQKEAAFREAKKNFQELEGRGWQMNQGNLAKEIAKLRAKAPAGGSWLASAAFNKACAELGYPEKHRVEPTHVRVFRNALAV